MSAGWPSANARNGSVAAAALLFGEETVVTDKHSMIGPAKPVQPA
jgi:hypothetical protein